MENSQAHRSRSRSGPRRTTHTPQPAEALGLLEGDLEPTEHSEDNHSFQPCSTDEQNKKHKLPWWKTPSPWWLLMIMPFTAIATSATAAPRIEIYTTLACSVHRPDIFGESFQQPDILDFVQHSGIPATAHRYSIFSIEKSLQVGDADTPPTRKQRCASDPVVQAAVAKLTTVIATFTGILSCITTGWWGAFSDRHGRTSVMGISVIGLLLTDLGFIIVTLFSKYLPGGYWLFAVGPMVEGALGGLNGAVAAIHAYLADTSNESSRSRIFSLNLGLMYTGIALGPTIGSLLLHFSGQILSVFYMALGLHILYSCFVWFILPESLTKSDMKLAKSRHADSRREALSDYDRGLFARFIRNARHLFSFLRPLAIFGPIEVVNGNGNITKGRRKDWNLTLLAVAYSFAVVLMGSYSFIFQYAASTFGWSSEMLGYWMTVVSVVRVLFLALILPITIKILKPKPLILEIPVTPVETTPLLDSSSPTTKTIKREIHSPLFDLNLARGSVLADIVSYVLMGLAQSPILFAFGASFGAFGAGFYPAAQSVALALYSRNGGIEIGRLFGGVSLIQAISSQIIGPFIYGVVYAKTVAIYPPMIYFVSVAALSVSFFLLSLVRIPKDEEYRRQSLTDPEEPGPSEESATLRAPESTALNF